MDRSLPRLATNRRLITTLLTSDTIVGFLFFLLIACFAAFEIYQLRPPQPVPATASPGEFSAERAFVHLGQIAPGPHPIGSPQQAQSRQYIVQELTKLGLKPEIQETISSNQRLLRSLFAGDIYLSVGSVQNVVARVPGAISNKAVLLMAHYDSVPGGPGASDNGVAVAALLEAARALRAGPPPKNDIIFLFTDGEEVGTLGANAFMKEHPWAREVGLVLNFEARGNTGSSLMFETSSNNGWLIREFVQAAPDPVASSLFYEVYKTLPNDSDLSIFKEAGVAGMNFAFIEGFTHYHTAIDSVEYVDPRSLQHHGNYALSLARHFGNLDLPNSHAGDYVYFNFFGKRLFSYPYGWIMPSVVLVALLFVGTMALGMRRGAVTAPGMLLGALVFLLPVIGSALLITLLWWGVTLVHPDYTTIRQGALYNDHWYITSFVFCAVAVTATCYLAFQKKIRTPDLALGALTWWVVLMIATAIYLPGGSYLFTWPLLLSLCGLLAVFATQTAFTSPRSIAILSLAALPGVILLTPIIYLLFVSLTIGAANLLIVFVVLLLGLFVPYLSFIATRSRWLLPAGAALVSIVLLIAGSFTAGFDRDHPKQNSVIYGLIADTGKALWASTDERPDEWSSQFFADGFVKERLPDFFPLVRTEFIQAPAPVAPLAAPEVNLLDDRTSEGVRTVRMQVRSPRGASAINVYIDEQTEVLSALVDGKQVYEKHGPVTHTQQWGLRHWTLPAAGIEVTLKIPAADPLRMVVVDQSYGLPTIPSITFRPRPEYMIASPFGFEGSEFTRVSRSFTLSEARSN